MNVKNIFGMLNTDGSIASWPEADLNGSAVVRENATRAQVDSKRFVVVPVNMEFTEELKTVLLRGYDAFQEWKVKVTAPPAGFTVMDEPAPPQETFGRKSKGSADDNV